MEAIPFTDWAILRQKWHNLDKVLINKFIEGCEEFSEKAHEKNLLKQFHTALKKAQLEFRIAFEAQKTEEMENENKQALLQMTNSTISLFVPKNENDSIHCVGVLWGFEQTETDTNGFKVINHINQKQIQNSDCSSYSSNS